MLSLDEDVGDGLLAKEVKGREGRDGEPAGTKEGGKVRERERRREVWTYPLSSERG